MTRQKYFQKRNNKIFALEKYIKGKSVYSRIIRRSTIVLIGTKLSASLAAQDGTRLHFHNFSSDCHSQDEVLKLQAGGGTGTFPCTSSRTQCRQQRCVLGRVSDFTR